MPPVWPGQGAQTPAHHHGHRPGCLLQDLQPGVSRKYPHSACALVPVPCIANAVLGAGIFVFSRCEMLKPMRKCRHPGCHVLTAGGYCPKHKPAVASRKASAAWHYLYTDPRFHWAEHRRDQLIREPWCRECARHGLRTPATDVDHIVPHRGDAGLFAHGELQSLCHSCHSRKTLAENAALFGRHRG